ncbi:ABC transporter substrate-binding protein [Devosia sp.]|uniref:ABC transporter substrate-binding protein n=1 Tax=Devosia sp. TaxID=1871048 RepID=UPI0035B176AD
MQFLKGSLALIAAALMTTTALAATEIRITHATTGGAEKEVLDKIIADFEAANPDIKVVQIPFDDDVYSNTGLITQLQSNDVPDIYFQWAGFPVKRDAEAGYAMDLTTALATDGWGDSFVPSVWTAGAGTMVDGKIYMIPTSLDVTNTIWYNEAIFEENGISPPATWAEFVALTKTLTDAGEIAIIQGNNEFWPFGNWASHIAAKVVPPAEYTAAFERTGKFSTPGFLKAFEYILELREAGGFNRDLQGLGADPAMATFLEGSAAMHPIGSWLIGTAKELADADFRYASFDTPVIDPDHPLAHSVIGTATGFVVHAKARNPEAAIKFLKFYTQPANQILRAEAGTLSPIKGVNETANLDAQTDQMARMLAEAPAMVPPPDTTYPVALAEAYYQAAAYVAAGEKSPADALSWLDETVALIAE